MEVELEVGNYIDVETDVCKQPSKTGVNGSGPACCVPQCRNTRIKTNAAGRSISYYRLPADPKRRMEWVKLIRRSQWTPQYHHRICSEHFVDEKKSDDPKSESYHPTIFLWNSKRNLRSTVISSAAGKMSPSKRPSTLSRRVVGRIWSPPKKLSNVKRALMLKRRTSLHLSAVTKRGRPIAVVVETPQINFHDYVSSKYHSVYVEEKLRLCDSILPGISDAFKAAPEFEAELNSLQQAQLSVENIKHDNDIFQFWTGLPSYGTFEAVFKYLEPRAVNLKYWTGKSTLQHEHFSSRFSAKPGPERKLSLRDEFFLCLVRLRTGLLMIDLASRFQINVSTASRIFVTWINFLYIELQELCSLPDIDKMKSNTAKSFSKFKDVHLVMDCTELFTEKPSNLNERKHTFSNYKHHQTFKFLVCISTHAQPCVVYVSRMYGGRASDKLITAESSDLLDYSRIIGGRIMCDRGFGGTYKMSPLGIQLVMPAFKGRDRVQLTPLEIQQSADISSCRIHVERIMQRIKIYHIFDGELMQSQKYIAEQIFTVCAFLTNFQRPILK